MFSEGEKEKETALLFFQWGTTCPEDQGDCLDHLTQNKVQIWIQTVPEFRRSSSPALLLLTAESSLPYSHTRFVWMMRISPGIDKALTQNNFQKEIIIIKGLIAVVMLRKGSKTQTKLTRQIHHSDSKCQRHCFCIAGDKLLLITKFYCRQVSCTQNAASHQCQELPGEQRWRLLKGLFRGTHTCPHMTLVLFYKWWRTWRFHP